MASSPFALLTQKLILLPSPSSGHVESYRKLFRQLHADASFCQIAFGDGFKSREWSDDEVKDILLKRDAVLRWGRRGMGDFALGLLPDDKKVKLSQLNGRELDFSKADVRIVEGLEFDELSKMDDGNFFERIEWAGYTCVRDGTTSSLESLYSSAPPNTLPPWQAMIEVRYGLDSKYRGTGIATLGAEIVMQWAVQERGARRFIAETQKANVKSGQVLTRLGFVKSGTDYFQDEDEVEWERVVRSA